MNRYVINIEHIIDSMRGINCYSTWLYFKDSPSILRKTDN